MSPRTRSRNVAKTPTQKSLQAILPLYKKKTQLLQVVSLELESKSIFKGSGIVSDHTLSLRDFKK